ncbi:MAG: biotin-dependent carboxyltransferase family protein, partial [Betaproteobacteria bacterium]
TIQDLGRFGFASQGVAQAGPMDSIAACWANSILNNSVNRPFVEIGGGGFVAEFAIPVNFAITGAWGDFTLDGQPLIGPGCYPAHAGSVLKIGRLSSGLFTYLAVEGGFHIESVLGSVATCQRDSLGGLTGNGAALTSGDELRYTADRLRPLKLIPRRYLDSYVTPLVCDVIMRYSDHFDSIATDRFLNQSYTVAKQQSRMGYRLDGQSSIESNRPRYSVPIPLGGIQIPPSGQPIVLMRDHQSLGGYPMIGTLTRRSLSLLAQRSPGKVVSFKPIKRDEATAEFYKYQQFFGDFR